jgi:hypothetical protein
MTHRLLPVITGQPLVNYIAIAELQPDVVHCIYTPGHGEMEKRLQALKAAVARNLPDVQFELHSVEDPYDSAAVWQIAYELLVGTDDSHWYLNRTAGTEQMRAPLAAAFEKAGLSNQTFFVETEKGQITFARDAWRRESQAFEQGITVKDYFLLHGQEVEPGNPVNATETQLFNDINRLQFDDVVASCKWIQNGRQLAEYDVAAVVNYRLHVFERKKLQMANRYTQTRDEQDIAVRHDIEKLAYTRAIFGGPFGKVYWLLSGGYEPRESMVDRMHALSIHFIQGNELTQLARSPETFGLPPRREK